MTFIYLLANTLRDSSRVNQADIVKIDILDFVIGRKCFKCHLRLLLHLRIRENGI